MLLSVASRPSTRFSHPDTRVEHNEDVTRSRVHRFAQERSTGDGARLLVAANAMHTDMGADEAGSAGLGWLLSMLAQDVGSPVPEGGVGMITTALVRRLTERGGRIDCVGRWRRCC